jgi:hypothetical protein
MNKDGSHFSRNRKEGDVTIDINNQASKKKIKKDIGDYVNYEEVDN